MAFKKKPLVCHSAKPEWGWGEIIERTRDQIRVRFEHHPQGVVTIASDYAHFLVPATGGAEITEDYRKAEKYLNDGVQAVFVSGRAGTGKSHFIHYLISTLDANLAVVAPTGIAALNVGGATIHSFFRLKSGILTSRDVRLQEDRALYQKLQLLIVDEVSMVRADMFDSMDRFLRVNRNKPDIPFGGVQLLLVGDLYQLQPVVTGEEEEAYKAKYASPWFFASEVFPQLDLRYVELGKVFRQSDEAFAKLLDKVRMCADLESALSALNARVGATQVDGGEVLTLTTTNEVADGINQRELAKLPGTVVTYKGKFEGSFKDSGRLPAPANLILKAGAKVMFTKNDPDKRWVNGTMGVVEKLEKETVEVRIGGGPCSVSVSPAEWKQYRYTLDKKTGEVKAEESGAYTQLPLVPAWATTIHKGQGKTLDKVLIDLGQRAFAPGQVYVALSRCRSLGDIALTRPIQRHEVTRDERIAGFYEGLRLS